MKVNGIKTLLLGSLVSLSCISVVSAGIPDTGLQSYISTSDLVLSTPYLDFNLWVLITLLGLGFLVLSNLCNENQAPKLWAIIAPWFIGPSAYFTLFLRKTSVTTYFNNTAELHVNSVNIITHPEWLCVVMSFVLVISFVNIWMHLAKKPMEKSKKEEVVGKGEF